MSPSETLFTTYCEGLPKPSTRIDVPDRTLQGLGPYVRSISEIIVVPEPSKTVRTAHLVLTVNPNSHVVQQFLTLKLSSVKKDACVSMPNSGWQVLGGCRRQLADGHQAAG